MQRHERYQIDAYAVLGRCALWVFGLATAAVICVCSTCSAEMTTQVSVPDDERQVYTQQFPITNSMPFDIAVVVNTDGHEVAGAGFSIPELEHDFPGVLKLVTRYAVPVAANAADASLGHYNVTFGGYAPACEALEIVRVTYVEFDGYVGEEILLEVGGPGPDKQSEVPVVYDCEGSAFDAPMGGATWGPQECTERPDGSLVLNGNCLLRSTKREYITPYAICDAIVSTDGASVGMLKARFRTGDE